MITGKTRVFFTIADPIDQVRAPELFNQIFAECGIDAVMVPMRVSAGDLRSTIQSLLASPSTGGLALSIPHKSTAVGLVDRATRTALAANAINAVRRAPDGTLEGDLFDGMGFIRSLHKHDITYRGKRVLLIGAGGSASAIAVSLASNGIGQLAVFDPDTAKSNSLADVVRSEFDTASFAQMNNDPAGFDLVINASPMGLRDSDPLPVDPMRLDDGTQVCDILMKNQPTPLIRGAAKRGMRAIPGFDMLNLQAPLYLAFFGYTKAADRYSKDPSLIPRLPNVE